jgi:hypothetical protein
MATDSSFEAFGFYGVLGLRPGATDAEINMAFNAIANVQDADILAFEVLRDAARRSLYDTAHGFFVRQGRGMPPVAASTTWTWLNDSTPSVGLSILDEVQQSAPPCLDSHRYAKKPRCDSDTYTCFGAATAGCVLCVRYLIEVRNVSLTAKSDKCGYTIEDFAEWETRPRKSQCKPQDPKANHTAVLEYLRGHAGSVGASEDSAPLTGVWTEVDQKDL